VFLRGFVSDGKPLHALPGDDVLLVLDAATGGVTGSLTLPEFGVPTVAPVGDDVFIVLCRDLRYAEKSRDLAPARASSSGSVV
jgi:hypothetical protein